MFSWAQEVPESVYSPIFQKEICPPFCANCQVMVFWPLSRVICSFFPFILCYYLYYLIISKEINFDSSQCLMLGPLARGVVLHTIKPSLNKPCSPQQKQLIQLVTRGTTTLYHCKLFVGWHEKNRKTTKIWTSLSVLGFVSRASFFIHPK